MPEFTRGFKSWAERTALGLRRDLGKEPYSPLNAVTLTQHLEVTLATPHDVPNLPEDCKKQLLEIDCSSWSAVTIDRGGNYILIYNPTHTPGRQSSDIMHELSHIIIGHEPAQLVVSADGGMVLRSYNQKQEDEAGWLAGSLLLPREALVHVKKLHMTEAEICQQYQVSEEMLRYRVGVTGVSRQVRNWRR